MERGGGGGLGNGNEPAGICCGHGQEMESARYLLTSALFNQMAGNSWNG